MTVELDRELDFAPAAAVQRQMWVVDRMDPSSCVYNEHLAFWLDGALDASVLENAWNDLVAAHDALRLVFAVRDGELYQAVRPQYRCRFEHARFDSDEPALSWGGQLVERRYDISADPPTAIGLGAVGDNRHLFVIGFHHAVMDAGSIGLLFEELGARYRERLLGLEPSIEPTAVGYTDFVAASQTPQFAERVEALLPAVLEKLRQPGVVSAEIPGDRDRPAVKSTAGRLAEAPFPEGIVPRLRAFAASHRVTPFQVLLAGMGSLLHRYGGQSDMVLGVGSSGRPQEYAEVVGPFSCVAPVRLRAAGSATFADVVDDARDAALRLETDQFVPFSRVVSELVDGRDPSRTPLVQIVFNAPPLQFAPDVLDGCRLTSARVPRNRSRFDLLVNLEWHGPDVVGTAEYDSALFDHSTVTGFLSDLGVFIDAAMSAPALPLDAVQLPARQRPPGSVARFAGDTAAAPDQDSDPITEGGSARGTRLEEHLLGHCRDLLSDPAVAATDDFFAVGGHSMVAARLIQRLSEEFDTEVPLLLLFENPVIADLAAELDRQFPEFDEVLAQVAGLSPEEIADLERLDPDHGNDHETAADAAPSSSDGPGRVEQQVDAVSPHEEPFWLMEQFAPGSAVNTLTLRIPGRGPLDVAAFTAALKDVVARHEILRTSYRTGEAAAAQRSVAETVDVTVEEVVAGSESADAVAERECRTGFDVSTAPLIRTVIVHTDDQAFEILLSCHHLVMDYWCVTQVMLPELSAYYRQHLGGPAVDLDPPHGYRSAILREATWRASPEARAQRRYWRERLDRMATPALSTDRPRPEVSEFTGATVGRRLAADVRDSVAGYARDHRTTSFAVLSAVTAATLNRRADGAETVLMCPVENRRQIVDTRVMGTFVNLIALRYTFADDLSLAGLVQQSRSVVRGGYANQSVPIAEALGSVGLENVISSGQGQYCVLNVFAADTGLQLDGCTIEPGTVVPHPSAGTDLELSVTESAAGLALDLKYRPSLWNASSMEALLDDLEQILRALIDDDSQLVHGAIDRSGKDLLDPR
ncbi:condensation domain-containing protein [Microlunatus soli]|uniref:HxxPF-repeated domain-containing protein n=1 Tax=Microlunatus soli TaxID=630515 RepID=A0A1H1VVK7_9ACTN|nr:condensation domain-containing protein [Microlunatus soli]SDS88069.1 HxxPF-repeated domain-containing protein [Microlunatus soli]